jgi:lipid-A-disaccharide synthase
MSSSPKNVLIIAAEASSAHYAALLIRHWKSLGCNHYFYGVGSQEMESLGFHRLGRAEEMAVVGVAEIWDQWAVIKAAFDSCVRQIEERRPDVVLLMDYPDFNLRLGKKMRAAGIKVFYYISPQVWAWRKSRIHDIKEVCEKVFLLFPFEKAFYDEYEVPCEFVGHPLLDDLDLRLIEPETLAQRRAQYGVTGSERILALMPGSRRGEIAQHMALQLEVAKTLLKTYPHLRLMIFLAPSLKREILDPYLNSVGDNYIILQDEPNRMISLAHYVLVASGTATLMVGLLEKPMVIMYRVKWLTGVIGNFLTRGLKFFGLVNLILDREVVPERKQAEANHDELVRLLKCYIDSEEHTKMTVLALRELKMRLGDRGATARVAEQLESYLEART